MHGVVRRPVDHVVDRKYDRDYQQGIEAIHVAGQPENIFVAQAQCNDVKRKQRLKNGTRK